MKLLVVEDEKDIAEPLIKILERQGFFCDYVEDGQEALEYANTTHYDCILLDLNIPKIDGIEVSKQLRGKGNLTPIIMLTARSQMYDKLEGFESGTDDYITKPFDFKELIARIQALIKRASVNKELTLTVGELILNPSVNSLEGNELKTTLTTKEALVLEYLIRNKGKVISTEELLEHVWDTNINEFTSTVKTHIKTLRNKMGEYGNLIQTIKGKGYIITK